MTSLSKFIGPPANFDSSLPSRRGVLGFVAFERSRLSSCSETKAPSNDTVFDAVTDRLTELFQSRGFDTCSKRSVKRLVYLFFVTLLQSKSNSRSKYD